MAAKRFLALCVSHQVLFCLSVQMNAAARCGGGRWLPWFSFFLLGCFVRHCFLGSPQSFQRGWRVVGLFDHGGAEREGEREEAWHEGWVLAWRG